MYIEIKQNAKRNAKNILHTDINYLSEYYAKNKKFPDFSQVLIETRTDCNRKCSFCAHSVVNRKKEVMKWGVYTKIIDSLAEINFAGRIAFLVSNEPLLEDRLFRMLKYARKKSTRFFLDLTTNGILLTLEKVDKLLSIGLDNININDYRHDRDIYPMSISENLIPIINSYRNNPKISYSARRNDEKLSNYAGNLNESINSNEYGFCNFPFRKLVFSVKGDVVLCCNDFTYKTNFGNVFHENILNIWHSKDLNHIRENLLKNNRINLCKECNDFQSYSIY